MIGTARDPLADGRAREEPVADGVRFDVPGKRTPLALVACAGMAAFTVLGPVLALSGFAGNDDVSGPATAFVAFWCVAWLAIAGSQLAPLLVGTFGREQIDLRRARLVLTRSLGPWRRVRDLDATRVEDLRVEPLGDRSSSPGLPGGLARIVGVGGQAIALTYGARTHRFGAGLDPAEARIIVRRLEGAL